MNKSQFYPLKSDINVFQKYSSVLQNLEHYESGSSVSTSMVSTSAPAPDSTTTVNTVSTAEQPTSIVKLLSTVEAEDQLDTASINAGVSTIVGSSFVVGEENQFSTMGSLFPNIIESYGSSTSTGAMIIGKPTKTMTSIGAVTPKQPLQSEQVFETFPSNFKFYENFSSFSPINNNQVIEHLLKTGVDVSTSSNESSQVSDQTSTTTVDTTNLTTNTSTTDNSQYMESNVNTNTQVDSSQVINTTNTTDNSSIQDISSSADTYNVDNSNLINQTINDTTTKIANTCGMNIDQAQAAVDIVIDESINTNIDASNTFMITGNNNTVSSVRLETELEFQGGDVQKNCVIDAANELKNNLDAINENEKSQAGGTGGDVSTEAGGNTTDNTNETVKEDAVDAAVDAGQDALQAATTTNENTAENVNENELTTQQSTEQSTEQTASAGGGLNINLILFIIIVGFILVKIDISNIITILLGLCLLNYLIQI